MIKYKPVVVPKHDPQAKSVFISFYYGPRDICKRKLDGKEFLILGHEGDNEDNLIIYFVSYKRVEEREKMKYKIIKFNEVYKPPPKMKTQKLSLIEFKKQFNKSHQRLSVFKWQSEGIDWEK